MEVTQGAQHATQGARRGSRRGVRRTVAVLAVALGATALPPAAMLSASDSSRIVPISLTGANPPPSVGLQPAKRMASSSAPATNDPGVQALDARVEVPEPSAAPDPDDLLSEATVVEVLKLVNAERSAVGLAPLIYYPPLSEAALAHAADQYYFNCLTSLTHTGTDGSNSGQRIVRTGFTVRTWGENIACNQRTPAEAMRGWMNSPGHRQNILSDRFTHIGISITRDSRGQPYWLQVFGTPL